MVLDCYCHRYSFKALDNCVNYWKRKGNQDSTSGDGGVSDLRKQLRVIKITSQDLEERQNGSYLKRQRDRFLQKPKGHVNQQSKRNQQEQEQHPPQPVDDDCNFASDATVAVSSHFRHNKEQC